MAVLRGCVIPDISLLLNEPKTMVVDHEQTAQMHKSILSAGIANDRYNAKQPPWFIGFVLTCSQTCLRCLLSFSHAALCGYFIF